MLFAKPWWVNLLIVIPFVCLYFWRRDKPAIHWKTLIFASADQAFVRDFRHCCSSAHQVRVRSQQHKDLLPSMDHNMSSMQGMDMQRDAPGTAGEQEMNAATTTMMSSHHMEMGPHMKMTELRQLQAGDQERASRVVGEARTVLDEYQDYHTALNDGFKIFMPKCAAAAVSLHQLLVWIRSCLPFQSGTSNFFAVRQDSAGIQAGRRNVHRTCEVHRS
jgi:hypothetical protein